MHEYDIGRSIGQLSEKLNALSMRADKHDKRIEKVEKRVSLVRLAIAVAVGCAALFGQIQKDKAAAIVSKILIGS